MTEKPITKTSPNGQHAGHRQRLRSRFLKGGLSAVADYELLELILFTAIPRGDAKPLAKELLNKFKTINNVLNADETSLLKIKNVGLSIVTTLKLFKEVSSYVAYENINKKQTIFTTWGQILDYAKHTMAYLSHEEFRILFIDPNNKLIDEEVIEKGDSFSVHIYPRKVVQKALENSATALILIHNHPAGDTTPSTEDIQLTTHITNALEPLDIIIHDHIIVAQQKHFSFKSAGLL